MKFHWHILCICNRVWDNIWCSQNYNYLTSYYINCALYVPSVNILINTKNNTLNGTNIAIIVAITINGPNGIYSSPVFLLQIINATPIIAPNKKAISEIIIIVLQPKNKPSAPISFTSPNPIASFPAIKPPTNK